MSGTLPHDADGVDLVQLGEALVHQWLMDRQVEQEWIQRESAVQTELARKRWAEMQRASPPQPAGGIAERASLPLLPPPNGPRVAAKPPRRRIPRPKLAKRVAEAWDTPEGKSLLTGLSMRDLAAHFGIASHTSFYNVPLFQDKILPYRHRGRLGRQAADWADRNHRDRHRG